ncbi:hypothetical protein N1496_04665 [Streptococcus didelphis]|uniref:Uncharacterized protein n=1 Tax=Streptococcus didelphis TaxID=102886 RepID=A0ABY9LIU8_9STRE|nr:hypothetical protein [Streptococcus didelphis]WMB28748.1 hypothetical protein N1496_04665 [Streptococcus didelphis]
MDQPMDLLPCFDFLSILPIGRNSPALSNCPRHRRASSEKRQLELYSQERAKRIQNLKDTVHLADKQSQLLSKYLLEQDIQNFQLLAQQLLPKIQFIKEESYQLKPYIPQDVYKRINQKADNVRVDTVLQLEQAQIDSKMSQELVLDKLVSQDAPEVTKIYKSVLKDSEAIIEKIKLADNSAELAAIHESSMQHFYDILNGYLKIKASPKDYYNAQERLDQALEALKEFDLDLDETLRKLNESDLKDFDISLRIIQKQSQNPDTDLE